AALIPLLVVFIFFIYTFNGRLRERREILRTSFGSSGITSPEEWGRERESTLRQLAEDSRLLQHLKQINCSPVTREDSELSKNEWAILKYLESFRDHHPEFEEIALKNPQTGAPWLMVPPRPPGESFTGVRMVVSVPILLGDSKQGKIPLLQGIINSKVFSDFSCLGKTGFPNVPGVSGGAGELTEIDEPVEPREPVEQGNSPGVPPPGGAKRLNPATARAGSGSSSGVPAAGQMSATKKMALVLTFFLAFIVISIPTSMFLIYRKMKKVIKSRQSVPYFSNSYGNQPSSRYERRKRK
ncbi:MAG: hypothetical protein AB1847_14700, partial [bacterium]